MISICLIILAPIIWSVMIYVAHFLPRSKLWIAFLCGISGGFCAGIGARGFPDGIILGLIIGMGSLIVIPSGLLTKYYQRKGREVLNQFEDIIH